MINRSLDVGLQEVKQLIATMAGYVETAIEDSIMGWKARNIDRIQHVYEIEAKVNASHLEIDAACMKLLATQQPLAGDLRLILGIIKINNDLERMVDQAVNISHNSEFYLKVPAQIDLNDLTKMAEVVKWMVGNSIDAFIRQDVELANLVCKRDDEVDNFKNEIFKTIIKKIKDDVQLIEPGFNLILIARNLERIGDHATNIAEDVIFTASGVDIRHQKRP